MIVYNPWLVKKSWWRRRWNVYLFQINVSDPRWYASFCNEDAARRFVEDTERAIDNAECRKFTGEMG